MTISLMFWFALMLPGYVGARRLAPKELESGLLSAIALSALAGYAMLSPVSILCYLLELPVIVFTVACAVAVLWSLVEITRKRWWGHVKTIAIAGASVELLIVAVDMFMGARVGAFLGGDANVHIARIRFLLDHGFSNHDPFIAGPFFMPIYHTNLLHALYASCSQLTGVDYLGTWVASLPWAKLLIASGHYYLGWCVFQRRWVAWLIALFAVGQFASMTYVVYPNKLCPQWITPMMVAFAIQACRAVPDWRVIVKLATGSLVLGQLHALYAFFAGAALGPVLGLVGLWRVLRGRVPPCGRRSGGWLTLACLGALFVAAPFAVVAQRGAAVSSGDGPHAIAQTKRFVHWEGGAVMHRPSFLEGPWGIVRGALVVVGLALALTGPRRREALLLLAMSSTIALVLYIPPLCRLAIDTLGQEWVVSRMVFVVKMGMDALAIGGIGVFLVDRIRFAWARMALAVGVVFLGGMYIPAGVGTSWSQYAETVKAPAEKRHGVLEAYRQHRALFRAHIPKGATVLAGDPDTESLLPMLWDCDVVAATRGGGISDGKQRNQDMMTMLDPRTTWPTRLALLRRYEIDYLLVDRRRMLFGSPNWVSGHLLGEPVVAGPYVLMKLDTR